MDREYTFKIGDETVRFTGEQFSNDIIKNTLQYEKDHPESTPQERKDNMMSVISKYIVGD